MPPAVVVRRKAFVKNGRGAGQSSAGACCESQNQANLGFAGQQRGRDVGVGQLPAVDSQAGKAAFAVVGILHPDVQPAAAEILVHCKARPFAGDGRCQAQPIQVRAQPQDALDAAHHDGGGCAGQPVHLGAAKMFAGRPRCPGPRRPPPAGRRSCGSAPGKPVCHRSSWPPARRPGRRTAR